MMPGTRDWRLAAFYLHAKRAVIDAGYAQELDWQHSVVFQGLCETRFLSEYAWVVLSSGMAERVIRKKFPAFSLAFHDWHSAEAITSDLIGCRRRALSVFNSDRKVNAIIRTAMRIKESGFQSIVSAIDSGGVEFLRSFPFMGKATTFHFAKNIGIIVAKPDRHLNRMADAAGFTSAGDLCSAVSEVIGDSVSEVDLVMWRYAELGQSYHPLLTYCSRGA